MRVVLAALPPLAALVLLLARRSAVQAALVALLVAAVVAGLAFPVPLQEIFAVGARLAPTAAEVVVILFGGLVLNELMAAAGAQQRLAEAILALCGRPSRAVMLIVLGVTPFAESVTGFGIGVVVAIPLLRQLGLPPVKAAIIGLLGLITVPWGSLGPGTLVAAQLGAVDYQQLGVACALLSAPLVLIVGSVALVVAFGVRTARSGAIDLLLAATVLAGTLWLVNATLGVPLAGVLGGVAVIVALLLAGKLDRHVESNSFTAASALLPYVLLIGGLLSSRAIMLVTAAPAGWQLLASPGLWLVLSCLASARLLGLTRDRMWASWRAGARRATPVATATVLFLAVGALLTAAGMSATLAEAAASLGQPYLLLAPFIGGLGGFVAGSNTAANAMFASSQAAAAQALGISPLSILAAHNTSAALTIMAAAPRVALATQVANTTPAPIRAGADLHPADTEPAAAPGQVLPTVAVTDLVMLTVIAVITAIGSS